MISSDQSPQNKHCGCVETMVTSLTSLSCSSQPVTHVDERHVIELLN